MPIIRFWLSFTEILFLITHLIHTVFILSLLVQLFYHLRIFGTVAFERTQSHELNPNLPVSVVVCVHNEEKNLSLLLQALSTQSHRNYEVIFVNDRSTDGSEQILRRHAEVNSNFRVINIDHTPPNWNHKKYALSKGIEVAANDYLLFTDGDCKPMSKNWITSMSSKVQGPIEIVLGYSPYRKFSGVLNAIIQYETLITALHYLGFARLGMPYMGVGRNLLYKKSLIDDKKILESIKNENGGDDDLIIQRIANKTNTCINSDYQSFVESEPKMEWKSYFRQKHRHMSIGNDYTFASKFMLALYQLSLYAFYIFGILQIALESLDLIIVAGVVLRFASLTLVLHRGKKRLHNSLNTFYLALLDVSYLLQTLIIGGFAILKKSRRWE